MRRIFVYEYFNTKGFAGVLKLELHKFDECVNFNTKGFAGVLKQCVGD